jgi:prepilin peptidase CpaA
MNLFLTLGVTLLVVTAAIIDCRTRKIPNWLTLSSCLAGVLANSFFHGLPGLFVSLAGLLAGFSLLIFVYLLGGMGAGDVKLLSAVGAFIGPRLVFHAFIWMAICGGVMAFALIIYKKSLVATFKNLRDLLFGWLLGAGKREMDLTIQNRSLHKLTYGVAIAAGTLLAVHFQRLPSLVFENGSIRLAWW